MLLFVMCGPSPLTAMSSGPVSFHLSARSTARAHSRSRPFPELATPKYSSGQTPAHVQESRQVPAGPYRVVCRIVSRSARRTRLRPKRTTHRVCPTLIPARYNARVVVQFESESEKHRNGTPRESRRRERAASRELTAAHGSCVTHGDYGRPRRVTLLLRLELLGNNPFHKSRDRQ